MRHASHIVGSDFPSMSIDLNLASGSHSPQITVTDYDDAIVLTFGLPGTTVVLHLTPDAAAVLARELAQQTGSKLSG